MEKVSLTHFVDFVLKVGAPKLAGVKDFKEHKYDHLTDFYKPLREAILEMHEKGRPDRSLDDFLGTLTDDRKRRIFPGLVAGYRKFLHASPKRWITPPRVVMPLGDIEIEVHPELGFEIDGRPTLIKTYFQGEPLAQKRVSIVLALISAAIGPARPGAQFAMLDVKNARLHPMKAAQSPRLPLLLRGEAASFSTIYAAV